MGKGTGMHITNLLLLIVYLVVCSPAMVVGSCQENEKIFCFSNNNLECPTDCPSADEQHNCDADFGGGDKKVFCSKTGTCVDLQEQCGSSCPEGSVWCPETLSCCENIGCGEDQVWCAETSLCVFPGQCPGQLDCEFGFCAETGLCRTSPYNCSYASFSVTDFSLDMDGGFCTVRFSNPVDYFSINGGRFRLQGSPLSYDNISFSLDRSIALVNGDENEITFTFSEELLNDIKLSQSVGTQLGNSFLRFEKRAVVDKDGEEPLAEGLLQASGFQSDITPPHIKGYVLNMNDGTIELEFGEPVVLLDELEENFRLESQQKSIRIGFVNYPPPGNLKFLFEIKTDSLQGLKYEGSPTTVSLPSGVIADYANNTIEATVFGATNVIPDSTSPTLNGFTIDVTSLSLELTFSEPMKENSFNSSALKLSPNVAGPEYIFAMSVAVVKAQATVVSITVDEIDRNRFLLIQELGVNANSSILDLLPESFTDMNSNPVIPSFNVVPTLFTPDTENPRVDSVSININNGTFQVTFSEPVDISTFSDELIRISDSINSEIECHLDSFVLSPDSDKLTFQINKEALDKIKLNQQLAIDKDSTFITFANSTVLDLRGNHLVGGTFPAVQHIPDTTPVKVVQYTIDYNSGQVKLEFQEPVDVSASFWNDLRLRHDNETFEHSIYFEAPAIDGLSVLLNFTTTTLDGLKIAKYPNVLVVDAIKIVDMAGNGIPATVLYPNYILDDTTAPLLERFDMDMNDVDITLTFTEPIDVSSFNFALTLLHHSFEDPGISYEWVSLNSNGRILSLNANKTEVNRLRLVRELARDANSTLISLAYGSIVDMNGNAITSTTFRKVDNFIADETPPQVIDSYLSIDQGTFKLYFSEAVDFESFNNTELKISDNVNSNIKYDLTSSTLGPDGTVLEFTIDPEALNIIKLDQQLAVDENSTFIEVTPNVIADIRGNGLVGALFRVGTHDPDTTHPSIKFYGLDYNAEKITLKFDEPVDVSLSLWNATQLVANDTYGNSEVYPLSVNLLSDDGLEVLLKINIDTLDHLKLARYPVVFRIVSNVIVDAAGLSLPPVDLMPFSLQNDTIQPAVVKSVIDMNELILDLYFSEPVDMLTFDHSYLSLHESGFGNATSVFVPFTVNSTNGRMLKLVSDFDAQINFKNLVANGFQIGKSAEDVFVSWNSEMIWDMNGNGVVSLNKAPCDNFIPDITPPLFTWIELDMNLGILYMNFTESISFERSNWLNIKLQGPQIASGLNVTFVVPNANSHQFTIIFDQLTLENIKLNRYPGSLLLGINTISDVYSNSLAAGTYPADKIIQDIIKPNLESFDLDMNAMKLILHFSEPVDLATFDTKNVSLMVDSLQGYEFEFQPPAENGRDVVFSMPLHSQHALRLHQNIATGPNDTIIRVYPAMLSDMNGNPVNFVNGMPVSLFTPDTIRPEV
eukprot:Nk52_evm1s309 gene=Nk52_evmTU1s309